MLVRGSVEVGFTPQEVLAIIGSQRRWYNRGSGKYRLPESVLWDVHGLLTKFGKPPLRVFCRTCISGRRRPAEMMTFVHIFIASHFSNFWIRMTFRVQNTVHNREW